MLIEDTDLPGVRLLTPPRFADGRGHFSETWSRRALAAAGLDFDFVQDNESLSRQAGTVRGLHFQAPPFAQAKLVRCVLGAIRDVAVDFRRGSPTFGRWIAVELSAENGRQLFIPPGFLHGFATCAPDSIVAYKCSCHYVPASEGSVRWNDPDLGIDWQLSGPPVLSDKDARAPFLAEVASPFTAEPAA